MKLIYEDLERVADAVWYGARRAGVDHGTANEILETTLRRLGATEGMIIDFKRVDSERKANDE